jgi:hypothetical protein
MKLFVTYLNEFYFQFCPKETVTGWWDSGDEEGEES